MGRGGVLALLLAIGLALGGFAGAAAPEAEVRRIEQLLRALEELPGAAFLRNDTAHGAREAGEHLRRKWRAAGARVKTAQDFIELCATRSSVSGQAYQIRFQDGSVMVSEAFLRARLAALGEPPR